MKGTDDSIRKVTDVPLNSRSADTWYNPCLWLMGWESRRRIKPVEVWLCRLGGSINEMGLVWPWAVCALWASKPLVRLSLGTLSCSEWTDSTEEVWGRSARGFWSDRLPWSQEISEGRGTDCSPGSTDD